MKYFCISCGTDSPAPMCPTCTDKIKHANLVTRTNELRDVAYLTGIKTAIDKLPKPSVSIAPPGLLFFGPPGTGKTTMAESLQLAWLKKTAKTVRPSVKEWWLGANSVRADNLLRQVRESLFENEWGTALEYYQDLDFLCINDLGAEKSSEWVQEVWHSLFDHRIRENTNQITLITSNLTFEGLQNHYGDWGEPIVSRLHLLDTYEILGEDYRRMNG